MPALLYKKRRLSSYIRPVMRPNTGRFVTARRARSTAMDVVNVPRMVSSSSGPKIFKLSIRSTGLMTASAGGAMAQIIKTNDPSASSDWANLAALYDQFQVLECWMNFFPTFNSNTTVGAMGYTPVHVCYDADSTAALASVDAVIQYGNRKTFNLFKPFRYGIKNRIQTDNSVNNAGMASQYRSGYGLVLDVASVAYYAKGIITWYADNLPANLNTGDVVIDYYVRFFERR